jgi:hypothetical protein
VIVGVLERRHHDGVPFQTLQPHILLTMKIILGAPAESEFSKLQRPPPATSFTSPIRLTNEFFVRVPTCTMVRPGSLDNLAAWDDSVATLRKIELFQGESVVLLPRGQGVVYSKYEVVSVTINVPDTLIPTSIPLTLPPELQGGIIMTRWSVLNMIKPFTQPWLWKVGSMDWNYFSNTDPTRDSIIVDPRITYDLQVGAGPVWSASSNAQSMTSGTARYFTQGFRVNPPVAPQPAIIAQHLVVKPSGVTTAEETSFSRPRWVECFINSSDILYVFSWLVAVAELTSTFENADPNREIINTSGSTGVTYPNVVKTLYTVFPGGFFREESFFRWNLLLWFPNWRPATGNSIVMWIAPDRANANLSSRVGSGFAVSAFKTVLQGSTSTLAPAGLPTGSAATNIQPL